MAYNRVEPEFTTALSRDLLWLVAGEKLGEGMSRHVYGCRVDPSLVVKFETDAGSFQNVAEWEIWTWVRGTKMERWFAPCVQISAAGAVLLQRRCDPIQRSQRPKRLPAYLCDLKSENFGMLDGRVVCCDYGTVLSALRSADKRLVKAAWVD